ncbi:MAG: response regulator [Alphaproteobacteria bacterium]|nr:response regulator [Alphaproteobacteria bacterium]
MHFLRQNVTDLPISKKLRLIIVGISFFVATVVGVAVMTDATRNTNIEVIKSLTNLSDIIATQAARWNDSTQQIDELKKDFAILQNNNRLRAVLWIRANNTTEILYGTPPLHWQTNAAPNPQEDFIEFNANFIAIKRTLFDKNIYRGTLVFYADTAYLESGIQRTLLIFITLLIAALLMSYALALRLEKVITVPIIRLSSAVSLILRTNRYSQRVERTSNDEVGVLIGGFNAMLDQIQQQTSEIHQSRIAAEDLVQQLWEAKDSAEEAHLAKTQFLARMSHEIRTPINGVLGMVDLLMNSGLSAQQKRLAGIVRNSGQTLLYIINDLLDFAKIEANKIELENIPYNLTDVTEGIVELVAQSAYGKGINIGVCIDSNTPRLLMGDPLRLRQVLTNLLGNAVKFTEVGEVGLYISVEEDSGATARIRFDVRDTGIGIPFDAQQKIFNAFSQADEQTTRRFGGTGLGLSIAWQLVALMGGKLTVESVEGRGSIFSFSLSQWVQPEDATGILQTPSIRAGTRILIIDNSTIGQNSLLSRLDTMDAIITTAETGEQGLQKIRFMAGRSTPFDLIILNARLPDTDAGTFIRSLTEQPTSPPRLLLLAPAADFQELEKQLNTEILHSLTLPLQNAIFQETLEKVLHAPPEPSGWLLLKNTTQDSIPTPAKVERASTTHQQEKSQKNTVNQYRILIAEDNPVNAEVARGMLVSFGYTVDCVANGRLAVEALEKTAYDLVLMDGQMPEMDGLEATRLIREREYALEQQTGTVHHVPIIAATANIIAGARENFLAAGMNDFIAKPFSREDLAAMVKQWIGSLHIKINLDNTDFKSLTDKSKTASDNDAAPFDYKAIDAILALNGDMDSPSGKEFLKVIVALYFSEMEQSLLNLADAVAADDADTVRYIAHKIKSSSANIGAVRLSDYARTLEANPETATEIMPRVRDDYIETKKILQEVSGD